MGDTSEMHEEDSEFLRERPSKSQVKREMLRLQDLGEDLTRLNPDTLESIPMSDRLADALREMRRLTKHEARRRQLQFIGKLMRSEDAEAIAGALQRLEAGSAARKRRLHELENWRDRMIDEGDEAVAQFVVAFPDANPQQIRQLVRGARKEREMDKPPAASRKLFRYLREILSESDDPAALE